MTQTVTMHENQKVTSFISVTCTMSFSVLHCSTEMYSGSVSSEKSWYIYLKSKAIYILPCRLNQNYKKMVTSTFMIKMHLLKIISS